MRGRSQNRSQSPGAPPSKAHLLMMDGLGVPWEPREHLSPGRGGAGQLAREAVCLLARGSDVTACEQGDVCPHSLIGGTWIRIDLLHRVAASCRVNTGKALCTRLACRKHE